MLGGDDTSVRALAELLHKLVFCVDNKSGIEGGEGVPLHDDDGVQGGVGEGDLGETVARALYRDISHNHQIAARALACVQPGLQVDRSASVGHCPESRPTVPSL